SPRASPAGERAARTSRHTSRRTDPMTHRNGPAAPAAPPAPVIESGSESRDVKTHMLDIAEQMSAERGLDGVSMRDVASAAGQRNNSAVQYHFGSRDGLIVEVLRRR